MNTFHYYYIESVGYSSLTAVSPQNVQIPYRSTHILTCRRVLKHCSLRKSRCNCVVKWTASVLNPPHQYPSMLHTPQKLCGAGTVGLLFSTVCSAISPSTHVIKKVTCDWPFLRQLWRRFRPPPPNNRCPVFRSISSVCFRDSRLLVLYLCSLLKSVYL